MRCGVNANPKLHPFDRRFDGWRATLKFLGCFVEIAEFNPAFNAV
jgi:hypothetical protein